MACNACHSSCGDCLEGGITFKRVLRPPALGTKPPARTVNERVLLFAEQKTNLQQGLEAQK